MGRNDPRVRGAPVPHRTTTERAALGWVPVRYASAGSPDEPHAALDSVAGADGRAPVGAAVAGAGVVGLGVVGTARGECSVARQR